MQPRTLDQIIAELQPSYQPSIEFLRQRQAEIPKTVEADIKAAQAAQTQAYEDILTGARRRGLGFAGIPLGEQAKYASTVFAPEVLRARTRGTEAARDLEGTILGLQAEMRNAAIARRQREQDIATELANASRGGGGGSADTSSATLQALLDYLRSLNPNGDNGDNRIPLDSIFGNPPRGVLPKIKVVPITPQTIVQPGGGVQVQPVAPSPQRTAPSPQISPYKIQGGGAQTPSGGLRVM